MRRSLTTSFLLAALAGAPVCAADGELDAAFGGDGIVSSGFGSGWQAARVVAPLADGALLAGGDIGPDDENVDFYVIRYHASGAVDGGWGQFGGREVAIDRTVGAKDTLLAIVPETQGEVTLLGLAADGPGFVSYPALARLTAGGDLDAAWGTNGIATPASFPLGGTLRTTAAAAHLDGYLFLGQCSECAPGSSSGYFLYRALATGEPDPAFGAGGWLGIAFASPDDGQPSALAVGTGGTILFAAWRYPAFLDEALLVHRRLASGAPDPAWSGDGLVERPIADTGWDPSALAIDPTDASVVVGLRRGTDGGGTRSGGLLRLSPAGVPDAGFGFPVLAYDDGSQLWDLEVDGAGRIFVAGTIDGPGTQPGGFFFARLLRTGELDTSFDTNGRKRVEIDEVADGNDGAWGLALSGGRPVAVGFGETQSPGYRFALVRLTNALVFADGFELGSTASW
jgi:uncharacterized delta-60 repeat protein